MKNDRVCGCQFVSGKSAKPWDRFNEDWIPSLHLGHDKSKKSEKNQKEATERAQRIVDRRKCEKQELEEYSVNEKIRRSADDGEPVRHTFQQFGSLSNETDSASDTYEMEIEDIEEVPQQLISGTATQTEEFNYLFKSGSAGNGRVFNQDYFRGDDDRVKFYTGLPSFEVLMRTFAFVEPYVNRRSLYLNKFQEFIMVLIKLRLNVPQQDIAYRFNVSRSIVSRVFSALLITMDIHLSPLISWPDREDLNMTIPQCFIDSFGFKTTVIIECFEIFIDKPTNLMARAQTYSNYKHHNTVKVLTGITPQGTISFVSEAWGGRTSDKFLTENCGILKNLLPGDLVLADRGFTIQEVWYYGAKLHIPAFTKGKSQLDPVEIEETRKIASVCIYVERVIGLLRQKYTILQSILPIDYLMCNSNKDGGQNIPLIDRILRVCSALVNLCPPIIPFDQYTCNPHNFTERPGLSCSEYIVVFSNKN